MLRGLENLLSLGNDKSKETSLQTKHKTKDAPVKGNAPYVSVFYIDHSLISYIFVDTFTYYNVLLTADLMLLTNFVKIVNYFLCSVANC